MTVITALGIGPLKWRAVLTAATAPNAGYVNIYNATAGALAPTLPQAAALGAAGAILLVQKDIADATTNAVTVTCYSGEFFTDGSTTKSLTASGQSMLLQAIDVDGVIKWQIWGDTGGSGGSSGSSLGYLAPARVATTTETLTIASGSVTTIAGTTVDGVSVAVPDRIVIPNAPASTGAAGGTTMSTQPANGVYQVVGVATNISVVRVPELGGGGVVYNPSGWRVPVTAGTANGGKTFVVISPNNPASTMIWGTTNVLFRNSLDGLAIGEATPATSIKANTMVSNRALSLSGSTSTPWLNQADFVVGTNNDAAGFFNRLNINDAVVNNTSLSITNGLWVNDNVASPAVGARNAIYGRVNVASTGSQTQSQAGYVGVTGRAETGANLGGTGLDFEDTKGSFWGGWFFGALTAGATEISAVYGIEIDMCVQPGSTVFSKVGLLIVTAGELAAGVRGSTQDVALMIARQGDSTTWEHGIMFGAVQAGELSYNNWPFDSTSTMIRAAPSGDIAEPIYAKIGIDFTEVTFDDAAIKVGAAPIVLSEMATPPVAASGEGRLYVASDGSLHYAGPTTDTEIAPA